MDKKSLFSDFEFARDNILDSIICYVREHNNLVKCSQHIYSKVSDSDRYYTERYKFIKLEFSAGNGVTCTYAYNPAQEDDPGDENGGWETFKEGIDMFSCDELYNIICDIKEE